MKKLTITVYQDPGHAWGKVERSLIDFLGIANKISHYSYQRKDHVYLEEDCDLRLISRELIERSIDVKFVEKFSNKSSKIRSYNRYIAI